MKGFKILFFVTVVAAGLGAFVFGLEYVRHPDTSALNRATHFIIGSEVIYWSLVLLVIGSFGAFTSVKQRRYY